MATSKVILNGAVAMDVTQTTVQSNNLESGATALDNKGDLITGSTTVGKIANLDWTKIKQCVNNGVDPSFLPIGTQIPDKWTWQGVTYDAPWDVVHYNSNGMYLQWEWLTPNLIMFDNQEAMYYVSDEGLTAGTYYFSIGYTSSQWTTEKHIQFTLSQACDPGDQFMLDSTSINTDPTASRTITVYGKGSKTIKQTAITSNGTEGIELGTFGAQNDLYYHTNGNCNAIDRMSNGSNCWSQSAVRQWLNSDAAAGEWWTPQNPWDRPPNKAETIPGFLNGFNKDFTAILEPTRIVTALNPGFDEAYEITYDKVFLPTAWQLYAKYTGTLLDIEGESWDYWKKKTEDVDIDGITNTTAAKQIRIKYKIDNHTTASGFWLRSPYISNGQVFRVGSDGSINTNSPRATSYTICPCCIIKKSTPTYIDTLNDIDWTAIKKMTGTNLEVGSQIIDSWIRSDNGTSVDVPWDIVHYDNIGIYLQWHYVTPFICIFDQEEAIYYVGEDGLPAGTYYISTGSATGITKWNNKNIQFTLTQPCDPGDQFILPTSGADPTANRTITIYGFGETTAKQTATTSNGTEGVLLGTINNEHIINGNCNAIQATVFGNHRWSQSNLRTWLNSDSPAGQWFTPQNPWDRPPPYVSYPGFLYGFSNNFKNALAYSENKTLLNTVGEFTNTYEITQDKIFLPSAEQINFTSDIYDIEGESWQYYQQLAKDANIIGRFTTTDTALIKYDFNNHTTARKAYLRTPSRTTIDIRCISSSGNVSNSSPNGGLSYCCPCCKINLVK